MFRTAAAQPELFAYGPVTPLLAYATACLGSALGLRCAMRAPRATRRRSAAWLVLGSVAVGIGIFTMHFVAMIGFRAGRAPVDYDMLTVYGSLGLAVLVSAAALFLLAHASAWLAVLVGGLVLGLGVSATHYLGMTGMRVPGTVRYDERLMAVSAAVAVAVTFVALWCATRTRHMGTSLAAALIMGLGFIGMHYTGMAGMSVLLYSEDGAVGGSSSLGTLTPVLIGPVLLLLLITLFVSLDPMMERDGRREWGTRPGEGTGEKLEWVPFEQR